MKWKFPVDQIRVGDSTYDIKALPPGEKKLKGAIGHFDAADQELCIDNSLTKIVAARTLLHEWMHAQLYERGVLDIPLRLEEAVCGTMEGALFQLLLDDELVRWLKAAAKDSQKRNEKCLSKRAAKKAVKKAHRLQRKRNRQRSLSL